MSNILAIRKLYPEVVFETADGVFTEDWTPVIVDEAAVLAKTLEMEQEYNAKAYARSRAAEYPSIADQLDQIYHEGIDAWKATIAAVKNKYPKGAE